MTRTPAKRVEAATLAKQRDQQASLSIAARRYHQPTAAGSSSLVGPDRWFQVPGPVPSSPGSTA